MQPSKRGQVRAKTSKKLVSVLATFVSVIKASKKDDIILDRISYIYYPLCFRKDKKNKMQALINFGSKVNTMTPAYILKLGLTVCRINVGAQKINGFTLKTFKVVLASFQMKEVQKSFLKCFF